MMYDVGHMHSAFHKALYKYPSGEIDEYNAVLFQIFRGLCVPEMIEIKRSLVGHRYCKNETMQFFFICYSPIL